MTEQPAPEKISVQWSQGARIELRAINRDSALQILFCLDRYLTTRVGDLKRLKLPLVGFRLRCADYRVFFDFINNQTIEVIGVRHPKDAYR